MKTAAMRRWRPCPCFADAPAWTGLAAGGENKNTAVITDAETHIRIDDYLIFGDDETLRLVLQQINPANKDEEQDAAYVRSPVLYTISTFLSGAITSQQGDWHMFVLSDAEMGKSSLLIMLKLTHMSAFWPQEVDCELLKLDADTLARVRAMEGKQTIYRVGKGGASEGKAAYEKAMAACPECYLPNRWRIWDLQPRWGGSFEKMQAFAKDAGRSADKNPRLAVLAGFVPHEACKMLKNEKKYAQAIEKCNEAPTFGFSSWFHKVRGEVFLGMKQYKDALADFEMAVNAGFQDAGLLKKYAGVLTRSGIERWEDAGAAILAALRLDPMLKVSAEYITFLKDKLMLEAERLVAEGHPEHSKSVYVLLQSLQPDDASANRALALLAQGADPRRKESGELAQLIEATKRDPHDIAPVLKIDALLFKHQRTAEIVQYWDRFIQDNPQNGPAYFERFGTYTHLRDGNQALYNVKKACELGVEKACGLAGRIASSR